VKIHTVRLIYFSPTRTTKKILESIAEGIRLDVAEPVDVTLPDVIRHDLPEIMDDELLVIGAPVYGGRLPRLAVQRLQKLKSKGNPAVIVVIYGNREYEDALLELVDLAEAAGFVPVAGGAFIGEHSFSTESIPLAKGRPDTSDIHRAREFGATVGCYLQGVRSLGEIGPPEWPGRRPYRDYANLPKACPLTERELCTPCGACAAVCPTDSISIGETSSTNAETCILCCACVKVCPENARALTDPGIAKIVERLRLLTAQRKEPQVVLGRDRP
jgi:ferredoxin